MTDTTLPATPTMPRIGDRRPAFTAVTTQGDDQLPRPSTRAAG